MNLDNEFRGKGRITNDVLEVRKTSTGTDVVNFCVAINRRGENAGVDFIDCCLFGKRVEALLKYAKKGTRIEFSGRLETRVNEYNGVNIKSFVVNINEFELLGNFDYKGAIEEEKENLPF